MDLKGDLSLSWHYVTITC